MDTSKYFRELTLNLQREGFATGPEANGLLPVALDGERLCVATEGGSIRYRKEDAADTARTAALDTAGSVAGRSAAGSALRITASPWKQSSNSTACGASLPRR